MSVAGGQALKNRYEIINNFGSQHISEILAEQDMCRMVDIGSGPGRNGIEISRRNPEFAKRLQIDCIEIDQAAIAWGQSLAGENGLSKIRFIQESMVKLGGRYKGVVDFGLNVGVVCGLPYQDRVRLLESHLSWFRPGGRLIVAGLTEAMARQDLLCAYILRETTGWGLQFRPSGELRQAGIEAGWKPVATFHDWPTCLYDIEIFEAEKEREVI